MYISSSPFKLIRLKTVQDSVKVWHPRKIEEWARANIQWLSNRVKGRVKGGSTYGDLGRPKASWPFTTPPVPLDDARKCVPGFQEMFEWELRYILSENLSLLSCSACFHATALSIIHPGLYPSFCSTHLLAQTICFEFLRHNVSNSVSSLLVPCSKASEATEI